MSNKNKSFESANKAKNGEAVWKRAMVANAEWPDKVSFRLSRDSSFFNENNECV